MVHFDIVARFLQSDDRRIFVVKASSENTLDNLQVLLRHSVGLAAHIRFNVWLCGEPCASAPSVSVRFPQHYLPLFQYNSNQMQTYLQQRLQDPDLVEYSRVHFQFFSTGLPAHNPVRMFLGIEIVADIPLIGASTPALVYQYDDNRDTDSDEEDLRTQVQFE